MESPDQKDPKGDKEDIKDEKVDQATFDALSRKALNLNKTILDIIKVLSDKKEPYIIRGEQGDDGAPYEESEVMNSSLDSEIENLYKTLNSLVIIMPVEKDKEKDFHGIQGVRGRSYNSGYRSISSLKIYIEKSVKHELTKLFNMVKGTKPTVHQGQKGHIGMRGGF